MRSCNLSRVIAQAVQGSKIQMSLLSRRESSRESQKDHSVSKVTGHIIRVPVAIIGRSRFIKYITAPLVYTSSGDEIGTEDLVHYCLKLSLTPEDETVHNSDASPFDELAVTCAGPRRALQPDARMKSQNM